MEDSENNFSEDTFETFLTALPNNNLKDIHYSQIITIRTVFNLTRHICTAINFFPMLVTSCVAGGFLL